MARLYRFFTRHLVGESHPQSLERPFHLTESLEPEIFYQLAKVLRAAPGDKVVLLPAGQPPPYFEYEYLVESAQKKEIVMRYAGRRKNGNELDFNLALVLCLPNKPDKLEFILQKAVELGATRITLVEGDFSQFRHGLRPERLEKIIVEAAEQSERAVVPRLETGGQLRKYLENLSAEERGHVFAAMERGENAIKLRELLKNKKEGEDIAMLVGPEGGFSKAEKDLMARLQIKCFTLGRRILRLETAVILSLGLAANQEF